MTLVSSTTTNMEPPTYNTVHSTSPTVSHEKSDLASGHCPTHGASKTPMLDKHVRKPETKATIQVLIAALSNALDEESCTQCATQTLVNTTTAYARDVRAAKKNGQWSKEENNALKAELKAMSKSLKAETKKIWKQKQ